MTQKVNLIEKHDMSMCPRHICLVWSYCRLPKVEGLLSRVSMSPLPLITLNNILSNTIYQAPLLARTRDLTRPDCT